MNKLKNIDLEAILKAKIYEVQELQKEIIETSKVVNKKVKWYFAGTNKTGLICEDGSIHFKSLDFISFFIKSNEEDISYCINKLFVLQHEIDLILREIKPSFKVQNEDFFPVKSAYKKENMFDRWKEWYTKHNRKEDDKKKIS